MRGVLVLSLVLAASALDGSAPTRQELSDHLQAAMTASRPAAQEALKQFEELITDENFASMGFASKQEAKSAELGTPFGVVFVRLGELKKYQAGDDPYKLLHLGHKVVYPVMVKGEARSTLEVREKEGKWTAGAFGLAGSIRLYAQARNKHGGADPESAFFLVLIPSLNHEYLAHRTDKGLRLVHVREQAKRKGKLEARPAGDVFAGLIEEAKEHDGKSR